MAQKFISSFMSRRLSTLNISSKSMHVFLSNLANRRTDRQTLANAFTSSLVGGNNSKNVRKISLLLNNSNNVQCD